MFHQSVTIAGIPIPSRDPWFLTTIAIHVAAGLVATLAGAVAMLSRKRAGRHPRAGSLYFWSLTVVFGTMCLLTIARWPTNNHLAVLGVLAMASAVLGRRGRRHAGPGWQWVHIPGMGLSYVFMLTAFYVDNGPHLPLWNRLPVWALWLLPAIVGIPIIGSALYRYARGAPAP
jgi:hypothetical protein